MTKPRERSRAKDSADTGAIRLGEIAYRRILEGLFEKRVPAGAFLSQSELMKLLDIPVQPLRDALRVLEAEGIVIVHPRSGIQFLKADLELARSTYQFRLVIERPAARAYAETGDTAEIAALIRDHQALIERIETSDPGPTEVAMLEELEQRLHGGMIASLRNPLIESTAQRIKNYVTLLKIDRLMTKPLLLRTLREHLELLNACAARDPDAAEAAIGRHFQAALQRIIGMV